MHSEESSHSSFCCFFPLYLCTIHFENLQHRQRTCNNRASHLFIAPESSSSWKKSQCSSVLWSSYLCNDILLTRILFQYSGYYQIHSYSIHITSSPNSIIVTECYFTTSQPLKFQYFKTGYINSMDMLFCTVKLYWGNLGE